MVTIVLLLAFVAIFSLGCNSDNSVCFKTNGEETTQAINVENFDKITLNGMFDVVLKSSDYNGVEITAGKNLIPFIVCNVDSRELVIEDKNTCKSSRKRVKPQILIKTTSLKQIEVNSPCSISSEDTVYFENLKILNNAEILETDLLLGGQKLEFCTLASTGDYNFAGIVTNVIFQNSGSGYLSARRLECTNAKISHESNGESEINALSYIHITDITNGKVYSFSPNCPDVVFDNPSAEAKFVNIGCAR